jgi:hypothetical protein
MQKEITIIESILICYFVISISIIPHINIKKIFKGKKAIK